MSRRRLLAVIAALVVVSGSGASSVAASGPPAGSVSAAPVTNSLTVYPSTIRLDAQRGQVIQRSVGIVQIGATVRDVSFAVTGSAADYLTIVDPATTEQIDRIEAHDGSPTYVSLLITPSAPLPDGELTALVEIIAQGGEVAVGSVLEVVLDVDGDYRVEAELVDASSPDQVVIGQPLHVDFTLDVEGNAPLLPDVALDVASLDDGYAASTRPPPVEPGGERVVRASWSTADWSTGRYDGEVVLSADGVEIGRSPVSVEAVPADQAARSINVLGAELVSDAEPGGLAKIAVTVQNVGAFEGRAVFVGDLWYDTEEIAPLRSDPLLVRPDETAELTVFAPTESAGTYRVRGRANLDGADSSTFQVEFEVEDPSGLPWIWIIVGAATLGAVTVGGGFLASRKRQIPAN